MKRLWIILLLLMSTAAVGQRIKYKDIYPIVVSSDDVTAISLLRRFMQEEPDHPSANFQSAILYEKKYKSYDPLIGYRAAIRNAQQAKNYYIKSITLVNDREVKKNDRYYSNFAKPDPRSGKPTVLYTDIKSRMDTAYAEVDVFLAKVPEIYASFTNAVSYYDQATKLFTSITDEYTTLKNLYLLYDDRLRIKFEALNTLYDSTLYFFDSYLQQIREYPIGNYDQKYSIRPIQTYRLDGLVTQFDFLKPEIEIWDYKTWTGEVMKMINGEITQLRSEIDANNEKLTQSLNILGRSGAPKDSSLLKTVDRELILKLRKYDFSSSVLPSLLYNQNKQHIHFNDLENTPDSLISSSRKLIRFSRAMSLLLEGRKLIQELQKTNVQENYQKHRFFIDSQYGGYDGLTNFVSSESEFVNSRISETVDNIREIILDDIIEYEDTTRITKYRRFEIPLYRSYYPVDSIQNELYTMDVRQNSDGSIYASGLYRPDKKTNRLHTYLVKTDSLLRVQWFKDISPAMEGDAAGWDHYVNRIRLTSQGCAMVIFSRNDSAIVENHLLGIDDSGKEFMNFAIEVERFPREISYSEKLNSYLLTFKGQDLVLDPNEREDLLMIHLFPDGQIDWENEMSFSGSIEEIINLDDGFLVFGNYSALKDEGGRWVTAESGGLNGFARRVDEFGKTQSQQTYSSPKTYHVQRVVKIDNSNINIIGFEGNYEKGSVSEKLTDGKLVHIITNSDLNLINSNLD